MEIYAEWEIVHSDNIGLEARRCPEKPTEYGINRILRYNEILPMLLFQRNSIKDISTHLSLTEGNALIIRLAYQTRVINNEFRKFLESKKDGVSILNAFIKSTYINEEIRRGNLI